MLVSLGGVHGLKFDIGASSLVILFLWSSYFVLWRPFVLLFSKLLHNERISSLSEYWGAFWSVRGSWRCAWAEVICWSTLLGQFLPLDLSFSCFHLIFASGTSFGSIVSI